MPDPLHYYEVTDPMGRWTPQTSPAAPRIVKSAGVERLARGTGPRIRGLRRVPPDLAHLTLDQLRECLSVDGRFYQTHREQADG
jgi:hypothetical protein